MLFRSVPGNGRISVNTEKWYHPSHYREKVESVRVTKNCLGEYRKRSNLCEYRKMAYFGSVPGKGRIRASVKKLSRGVREKGRIFVSTEKGSNLCEYRKMASSGSVPGKGRIRASVEKLSRGVPEKGRICGSTEKWHHPGQYREKVESVHDL